MATLDYSNRAATVVRPILGRVAAWCGVAWSVGLTLWLIPTAQTYFLWNHGSCGTPAARMHQWFFLITPLLIGLPAGGWATAHVARFGERLARGSFLASLAAW